MMVHGCLIEEEEVISSICWTMTMIMMTTTMAWLLRLRISMRTASPSMLMTVQEALRVLLQ